MLPKLFSPSLVALIVALAIGFAGEYGFRSEQERIGQAQRNWVTSAIGQYRAALEGELNSTLYLINGLIAYVSTHSVPEPKTIVPMLKTLHDQGRYLRNIGLAPGNRLTYVYPLEGNEKALGLYYPDIPEQWPAVERAIRERQPRLAGPLQLKQGGIGFIYRVPVFTGATGEYWGLLSAVIDEESLFAKAGVAPKVDGLELALRGQDGTGQEGSTFMGDAALFASDAVTATVHTPGGAWEIAGRPVGGWSAEGHASWLRIGSWGIGILLGLLVYRLLLSAAHRLRTEADLAESELRFRGAFETAAHGMALVSTEGLFTKVNPALCAMLGYAEAELLATTFQTITHPDDLAIDLNYVKDLLAGRINSYQMEKRYFHKTGKIVWILLSVSLVRNKNGTPIHFVSQVQDISERKLHQQRTESFLAEQKVMLENELVGIVKVIDRKIAWANPAFENMLGYEPGELVGTPTRQNYVTEEDYLTFGAAAYPALADGNVFRSQIEHVRKDGQHIWVDVSGSILDRERGESLWCFLDITERKRLEQITAQSEQRMELALSGANLGLWDLDIQTGKIAHNPRLVTMFGFEPDEVDANVETFLPRLHIDDAPALYSHFYAHLKGEVASFRYEYRVRHKDDHWVWVLSRGKVVERDENGRALRVTGTNLDISERKRNEAALKARETRLSTLIASMQDTVIVLDTGGTVVEYFHSPHSTRPSYKPLEKMIGETYDRILPANVAMQVSEAIAGIMMDEHPRTFEYSLTIDGKEYFFQATTSPLLGETRFPIGFLQVIRDITVERTAQQELERLARTNTLFLESVGEGLYGVDLDGHTTFVNPAALNMLGFTEAEVLGQDQHDLLHHHRQNGTSYPVTECPIRLTIEDGQIRHVDNEWFWRKDGSGFPVAMTVTPVVENDRQVGAMIVFQDISERKANEARIHELAYFDPLTNLPNRRLLVGRLGLALFASARRDSYGAILFLDLDKFKSLNDTKGHEFGDLLLKEAATRLLACVRAEDTVARLGGDEFVVMLEGLDAGLPQAEIQAGHIGEKIRQALSMMYLLDGHEHHCTSSIGISLFKGSDVKAAELLKRADMAMYQAKSAGRNAVRYFQEI